MKSGVKLFAVSLLVTWTAYNYAYLLGLGWERGKLAARGRYGLLTETPKGWGTGHVQTTADASEQSHAGTPTSVA